MTTYVIDYSDPLRTGFSITPGSFDGPGGNVTSTSLRLYGRGTQEWGESVDENLVRLLENSASATTPLHPIAGQLYFKQQLYWRDSTVPLSVGIAPAGAFYRFNLSTFFWNASTGTALPFTVVVVSGPGPGAAGTNVGDYVWSIADSTLYRWDSAYKQAPLAWMPRFATTSASAPVNGVNYPAQSLLVFDQFSGPSGAFVTPPLASANLTGIPIAPTAAVNTNTTQIATTAFVVGQAGTATPIVDGTGTVGTSLLYSRQDHVHPTDITRAPVASPTFTGTVTAGIGGVNMSGHSIINLSTPSSSTDAATKGYVDAAIVPPGTIISFAGTSPPTGYLLCPTTLTTQLTAAYPALFAAVGYTWGGGGASFGIPWFPADTTEVQADSPGSPVGTTVANGGSAGPGGVRVLKCVKY